MSNINFSSNENKALLWNLMFESGVFHDIPGFLVSQVKSILDDEISLLENKPGTLLEKNKVVVSNVVNKLIPLRSQENKQLENWNPVTANEITNQRQQIFSRNLKERQKEFESLSRPDIPDAPDFSDKNIEKPIGSEINQMVSDIMERRARELAQVINTQDRNVAEKWLTGTEGTYLDPTTKQNNSIVNSEPRLTIGEKIDTPLVTSKRVSFNEHHDEITISDKSVDNNIFNRFKKTSDDMHNIINKIKTLVMEINERNNQINMLLIKLEEDR